MPWTKQSNTGYGEHSWGNFSWGDEWGKVAYDTQSWETIDKSTDTWTKI